MIYLKANEIIKLNLLEKPIAHKPLWKKIF